MNDSASCVPINVWVRQWGICNAQKHLQHFIKELAPPSLAAAPRTMLLHLISLALLPGGVEPQESQLAPNIRN